ADVSFADTLAACCGFNSSGAGAHSSEIAGATTLFNGRKGAASRFTGISVLRSSLETARAVARLRSRNGACATSQETKLCIDGVAAEGNAAEYTRTPLPGGLA